MGAKQQYLKRITSNEQGENIIILRTSVEIHCRRTQTKAVPDTVAASIMYSWESKQKFIVDIQFMMMHT